MFELFSRSYYLGRLYVTPTDGGHARMQRDQHERVNEELYTTGEGIERTDTPLVMKLETTHFTVHGDDTVPTDTLVIPESLLEETRIRNPPTLREVFLARKERARQLLEWTGGTEERSDQWPNSEFGPSNAGT